MLCDVSLLIDMKSHTFNRPMGGNVGTERPESLISAPNNQKPITGGHATSFLGGLVVDLHRHKQKGFYTMKDYTSINVVYTNTENVFM